VPLALRGAGVVSSSGINSDRARRVPAHKASLGIPPELACAYPALGTLVEV